MTGIIGDGEDFDIALKKVSLDGDSIWTRLFALGHWDMAYCVQQTIDGGFILAGSTDAQSIGYSDALIIKTDSEGEPLWNLTLGGPYSDLARCIQQTSDGGFIACGFTHDGSSQYVWLIRISSEGTLVDERQLLHPDAFELHQAYPNPFNASTTISYSLPERSDVRISVYDILGRPAANIIVGEQPPGLNAIRWDAGDLSSGTYFYRVQTNESSKTGKLILLR